MVRSSRCLLAAVAGAVAVATACNPVLSDQISALGPETPGVPRGPLHRPGQPCTLCHDGALGDPPAFAVAGTVFQSAGDTTAAEGVTVTMTDVRGVVYATTTNAAGNFYVTPGTYQPIYPMHVSIAQNGTTVTMQSHVGWSGACALCHKDPAASDSPGHVYLDVPPGGTP